MYILLMYTILRPPKDIKIRQPGPELRGVLKCYSTVGHPVVMYSYGLGEMSGEFGETSYDQL